MIWDLTGYVSLENVWVFIWRKEAYSKRYVHPYIHCSIVDDR